MKILQCEERLQAEIAERECLLAAVKVLRGYAEKGKSLKGVEVGALGQVLLAPGSTGTLMLEAPAEKPPQVAAAAPAPAPALAQPKPYRHPELAKLCGRYGNDTAGVRWAIDRMNADFTLHDIAKLLEREGYKLKHAKISVVLTRLQRHNHLKVIRYGRGPMIRLEKPFSKPKTSFFTLKELFAKSETESSNEKNRSSDEMKGSSNQQND